MGLTEWGFLGLLQGRENINVLTSVLVNYNDLTATSLEIMVSKGNHHQMALIRDRKKLVALIQVGEIL